MYFSHYPRTEHRHHLHLPSHPSRRRPSPLPQDRSRTYTYNLQLGPLFLCRLEVSWTLYTSSDTDCTIIDAVTAANSIIFIIVGRSQDRLRQCQLGIWSHARYTYKYRGDTSREQQCLENTFFPALYKSVVQTRGTIKIAPINSRGTTIHTTATTLNSGTCLVQVESVKFIGLWMFA